MPSGSKTKDDVRTYLVYLYPNESTLFDPASQGVCAPKKVYERDVNAALKNMPGDAIGFRFFDAVEPETGKLFPSAFNISGSYYVGEAMSLKQAMEALPFKTATTKPLFAAARMIADGANEEDKVVLTRGNGLYVLTECDTVLEAPSKRDVHATNETQQYKECFMRGDDR